MENETADDNEKQRRLELMRRRLTPISEEQAREIAQERLYEAMRPAIERDDGLLDLFPPEFAAKIRKERSNG